ncbi:hypothetical protein [Priestia taiwanensis]|uniref:hypothetical protein n=1 Tax=Priestia taiwanensis TaxID=1347902 RepID=UPI00166B60D0|nr:hypothetical protein [Priestia taiwanensis]MBM7363287.1 hypothetical protein [Priestia taiwanensis]
MNICVAAITGAIGTDVRMNPLERGEDAIFHHRFSWIAAISEQQAHELRVNLVRRMQTAGIMAGIEEGMDVSVELPVLGGVK